MNMTLSSRRIPAPSIALRNGALLGLLTVSGALFAQGNADTDIYLEEILVTATKTERNVQDIPVAVSAYSGALLTDSGIRDMRELSAISPSLTAFRSQTSTNSSFSIRGIGTSSQNFGLESSVGLYVDGVYRSRQNSIINDLVDVEAVEVLRGPQGTLFGKNTPSGAISIRTVRPSHEQDAFIQVGAGNWSAFSVAGAGNLSLVDDVLAARATVFSTQRDGYVNDVRFGDEVINDRDRFGGRLQFYYTPSDSFNARVIADYSEIDEVCCGTLTRLSNLTAIGRTDPMGGPVFGSDALVAQVGGTVFQGSDFDDYTTALNFLPESSNEDAGLSLEMNFVRDGFTVTSVSAVREFSSFDSADSDFSDLGLLNVANDAEVSSFSQEIRANWNLERATIVAGAYYFTQDIDSTQDGTLGDFSDAVFSQQPDLAALIAGLNAVSAASGGALPMAAVAYPADASARNFMRQDQESFALFAQGDFDVSDAVTITAGLRFTSEEKSIEGTFTNSPLGPPPDFVAIATNLGLAAAGQAFDPSAFAPAYVPGWGLYAIPGLSPRPDLSDELDDDQVTGTFKVSWRLDDSSLLYASYGTGFKSGGTNTDRISLAFPSIFQAETSEAIELGFKKDFEAQNLRINFAVFDTAYDDLQANSFTGTGFNLQNAGTADTAGAELELWWYPTDSTEIQASYAYTKAEFDEFLLGTCWIATPFHFGTPDPGQDPSGLPVCDRSGDDVAGIPDNKLFLAARQEFQLGQSVRGYVRAEYSYLSETVTDGNNDPLKLRDDFDNVNLRLGLVFDNLDAEVTLWARNLTDQRFFETVFDVPLQAGKLNAYPHEPRSYGITLRKSFR